jgi:hypothetical protein
MSVGGTMLMKEIRRRELWPEFLRRLQLKFNPYHRPPGSPEGGEFTFSPETGAGGSATQRHRRIVTDPVTGERAFRTVKDAQAAIAKVLERTDPAEAVTIKNTPRALRAAVVVHDTLKEMKQNGFEMPNIVHVDTDKSVSGVTATAMLGTIPINTLTMNVTGKGPKGMTLDQLTQAAFGKSTKEGVRDFAATKTFSDLVVHEMGHVAQSFAGPRWHFNRWSDVGLEAAQLKDAACRTVSRYARLNPSEFIAEAFLLQYRGQRLAPPAARLYKLLNGQKMRKEL